jgi:hypothetical protein
MHPGLESAATKTQFWFEVSNIHAFNSRGIRETSRGLKLFSTNFKKENRFVTKNIITYSTYGRRKYLEIILVKSAFRD